MAAVQEVRITQPVARSSCAELQASLCSVESRVVAISPDQGAVRSAKSAGSNPVVHSARATASTGVRKLQPSTGRRCERPQDTLWSRLCSCATGPQVSRTRGRTERSVALCRMQGMQSTQEEPREWLRRLSASLLHAPLSQHTQLARAVAGGATGGSSEALVDVFRCCVRSLSELC